MLNARASHQQSLQQSQRDGETKCVNRTNNKKRSRLVAILILSIVFILFIKHEINEVRLRRGTHQNSGVSHQSSGGALTYREDDVLSVSVIINVVEKYTRI